MLYHDKYQGQPDLPHFAFSKNKTVNLKSVEINDLNEVRHKKESSQGIISLNSVLNFVNFGLKFLYIQHK